MIYHLQVNLYVKKKSFITPAVNAAKVAFTHVVDKPTHELIGEDSYVTFDECHHNERPIHSCVVLTKLQFPEYEP